MELNSKQWITIILVLIIDIVLIAMIVLALVPQWAEADPNLLIPNLTLYMSPLIALAIILVPTLVILKYGWDEKIKNEVFLLPLRIALGYEFFHGGLEKLIDTTYLASPGLIGYGSAAAPSPWIQSILSAMLPNYVAFLLLIAVGELLVGLSILFGGFTRLGAFGGILLHWTFLFLLGWLSISTFGINFVGAVAFLVLGLYRSGRFIGIDQFLGPKLENSENKLIKLFGHLT
ncbi:DoxX family membrane protein [Candidatus Thorarchaeota archaeon]|nr:MAG: DoxX family membrane protein [Candidatus Thorarchaeota archaeon]